MFAEQFSLALLFDSLSKHFLWEFEIFHSSPSIHEYVKIFKRPNVCFQINDNICDSSFDIYGGEYLFIIHLSLDRIK